MIERVVVHGWQSLRAVDLRLGRLSVIVGPSSSGKTALIRALRAVASNIRGAAMITRGAKAVAITVHTTTHTITLERTETSGRYRLVDADGTEREYTKLGGGVPAAVTAALRITPTPTGGTSLNFAGQFDPPYLLADSGATVALVLGDLTNVALIFAAVAEANRRKRAATATLKTREADLTRLRERLTAFTDLPTRLTACTRAEQTAHRAAALTDQTTRLRASTQALVIADGVLARHAASLPVVPTEATMSAAAHRLTRLQTLLAQWQGAGNQARDTAGYAMRASATETELQVELHAALIAAGTCPTCGQQTTPRHPTAKGSLCAL